MSVLANVLFVLAVASLAASAAALLAGLRQAWRNLTAAALGLLAVECALKGAWFGAVWNAVLVALILGTDWWNRRGRKAARQFGAKSRALVENLVERVREAGSPVPQGAAA